MAHQDTRKIKITPKIIVSQTEKPVTEHKIIQFFNKIATVDLTIENDETKQFRQSNKGSGKGKEIPTQEANFARYLNEYEIEHHYQPHGSQKSPDFWLFDKSKNTKLEVELKSSKSNSISLNDHWFQRTYIYVISCKSSVVALGQHIPTDDEHQKMSELKEIIKKLNEQYRTDKSLSGDLYVTMRCANSYKTGTMIKNKDDHLTKVIDYITRSLNGEC